MVDHPDMFDPARHSQPPPVVNFPGAQQPPKPAPMPTPQQATRLLTEPIQNVGPQYVQLARAVSQILATRILLLIAVITAAIDWSYVVYSPSDERIIAGAVFSVLVGWPLVWLYFRKG